MYSLKRVEVKGIFAYFILAMILRLVGDVYEGFGEVLRFVYLYPLIFGMLVHCILLSFPPDMVSHRAYGIYNIALTVLILRSLGMGLFGLIDSHATILYHVSIALFIASLIIFFVELLAKKSMI